MPLQHVQWITIDECITSYLNESEQSNAKYFKLWHLAFDAMNEMGMDSFYSIKSIKVPVNANLTVTIPADCIKISKVGVFNEQGAVIPLSNNNTLSTAYDLQASRLQNTQDPTIPTIEQDNGTNVWFNYWNGYSVGNVYGIPSGAPFVGSYKIDNANGVIVLSEYFSYPYIVLEYVASPQPGGEYYLPIQFKQAIIAYLAWKDIKSIPVKTHAQNAGVEARRRDYYNERRLAIARYDPVNLADAYEWELQKIRLAIKG